MADVTLKQVWQEVKRLAPAEIQQLRQMLNQLLAPSSSSLNTELEHQLLQVGLVREIKPAITDFTPYQNRKPIAVKGKPVSQTIVEERR